MVETQIKHVDEVEKLKNDTKVLLSKVEQDAMRSQVLNNYKVEVKIKEEKLNTSILSRSKRKKKNS